MSPEVGGCNLWNWVLQVVSLSENPAPVEWISIAEDATSYTFRELTPGATYQVQLFSVFENKESVAYTSRNFTTSKLR